MDYVKICQNSISFKQDSCSLVTSWDAIVTKNWNWQSIGKVGSYLLKVYNNPLTNDVANVIYDFLKGSHTHTHAQTTTFCGTLSELSVTREKNNKKPVSIIIFVLRFQFAIYHSEDALSIFWKHNIRLNQLTVRLGAISFYSYSITIPFFTLPLALNLYFW